MGNRRQKMSNRPTLHCSQVVRQVLHKCQVRGHCVVEPFVCRPEFTPAQFGKRGVERIVNPRLIALPGDGTGACHHIRMRHQLYTKTRKPCQRLVYFGNDHCLRMQPLLQDAFRLIGKQRWSDEVIPVPERVRVRTGALSSARFPTSLPT